MKYVSESYQQQLHELAADLVRPAGGVALQDTAEFDPIPEQPTAQILQFPHRLQLRNPAELGWEQGPDEAA